jgi:hypothetical protein
MLGNLFQRSTDQKKHVSKKQNVEIDSPASSGGQEKYVKYASVPWPPLEAALPIFNVSFFLLKNNF